MLGAITGDIIGSGYESFRGNPDYNFQLFKGEEALTHLDVSRMTDDSILTLAVADYMQNEDSKIHEKLKEWYREYPDAGYGNWFINWAKSDQTDGYNSYGNGSAMRVSPVPYYSNSMDECMEKTIEVTEVTHDHPHGIRGALATSLSIWLSLKGASKSEIKDTIESQIDHKHYRLDFDYNELQESDAMKPICQISVPRSLYCFLISNSFEDAIRKTVCMGGDTDTNCAIVGSIAEAFYGYVEKDIRDRVIGYFDDKQLEVYMKFAEDNKNINDW